MGPCASKRREVSKGKERNSLLDAEELTNVEAVEFGEDVEAVCCEGVLAQCGRYSGEDEDFPKKGVKISVFQSFVNDYRGKSFACFVNQFDNKEGTIKKRFEEMTTTDVCNHVMKPLLAELKCSYCEYLEKSQRCNLLGGNLVGTGSVFISHAWKYKFLDVVDAIEQHFYGQQDVFIWFDLFSNNQIVAPKLDFTWWSNTFKTAIQSFGHLVVVISPWQSPIPLTRAWCVFEIFCAAQNGKCIVELAMSSIEKEKFMAGMKDDRESFLKMLGDVDVDKATCFKHEDRKQIFRCVGDLEDGKNTINAIVCAQMQKSTIAIFESGLIESKSKPLQLQISEKFSAADIYNDLGYYRKSMEIYQSLLPHAMQTGGALLAATYDNIGCAHFNLLEHHEALQCYRKASKILQSLFDEEEGTHRKRRYEEARLLNNIATTQSRLGMYDLAIKNLKEDIKITKEVYGENSIYLAASYNNLALAYYRKGKDIDPYKQLDSARFTREALQRKRELYDLALLYYGKDLKISEREYKGNNHVNLAKTYNNIAIIYGHKDDPMKALDFSKRSLHMKKTVLGEQHTSTITAHRTIGLMHEDLGKRADVKGSLKKLSHYKAASKHFDAEANMSAVFSGEWHPSTRDARAKAKKCAALTDAANKEKLEKQKEIYWRNFKKKDWVKRLKGKCFTDRQDFCWTIKRILHDKEINEEQLSSQKVFQVICKCSDGRQVTMNLSTLFGVAKKDYADTGDWYDERYDDGYDLGENHGENFYD